MNNSFYERLSKLALRSAKSINQIERELGYPRNALHNYKYTRNPSGVRLTQLANYFGVTPEYLIGLSDIKSDASMKMVFESLNTVEKLQMFNFCQSWIVSKIPSDEDG